jgi:hypothetical protein
MLPLPPFTHSERVYIRLSALTTSTPFGTTISSSLTMLLLGDSLRDARYKSPWKRPWFTRQSSLVHKAMNS